MKKILALALALIMLSAFVGCNVPRVEISRGTIDGSVYKNEVLDFEFTKPSSWVYYTDEEIAATMNFAVDNLLDDKFQNALENNSVVYDMMVVDSITRTNISVGYENLGKTSWTNMTEKQYIEALKNQLSSVSSMNVTFTDEIETVKLGNTEFTKCVCTNRVSGVSMTQVYYLRNIGGYMAMVIVTIPRGYTVAKIEGMFK
jgi:hypothetical protein